MSDMPPPPPPSMSPPPGYQPYGGFNQGPPRSLGKAPAAMVCGIVGLIVCSIVLSPVALGLGISAKNEIDRNPGAYTNRGQAQAGFVLGIIGICLIPVSLVVLSRLNN